MILIPLERHPAAPTDKAQRTVALMISAVARDHPTWLWNGVSAVSRLAITSLERASRL
jgi:hypothetical protein